MERHIRLRRSADIQRVRQEGRSWAHPLLVLVADPNKLDFTRIGVIASRRVGNAVVRNRAKRLVREAVRHHYLQLTPGWDLLLIARSGIQKAREPQVREALGLLMSRARLLVQEIEPR